MRRVLLVAIPLAFIALLVLVNVLPKGEYRLPFAKMEVESITLYLSSESAENGKKYITAAADIENFLALMEEMSVQGNYRDRDLPDGGHYMAMAFHLTDGNTFKCACLQTSQYGSGMFTDGERAFKVRNLPLLEHWYTLDYELFPIEAGETDTFPSIIER